MGACKRHIHYFFFPRVPLSLNRLTLPAATRRMVHYLPHCKPPQESPCQGHLDGCTPRSRCLHELARYEHSLVVCVRVGRPRRGGALRERSRSRVAARTTRRGRDDEPRPVTTHGGSQCLIGRGGGVRPIAAAPAGWATFRARARRGRPSSPPRLCVRCVGRMISWPRSWVTGANVEACVGRGARCVPQLAATQRSFAAQVGALATRANGSSRVAPPSRRPHWRPRPWAPSFLRSRASSPRAPTAAAGHRLPSPALGRG